MFARIPRAVGGEGVSPPTVDEALKRHHGEEW